MRERQTVAHQTHSRGFVYVLLGITMLGASGECACFLEASLAHISQCEGGTKAEYERT